MHASIARLACEACTHVLAQEWTLLPVDAPRASQTKQPAAVVQRLAATDTANANPSASGNTSVFNHTGPYGGVGSSLEHMHRGRTTHAYARAKERMLHTGPPILHCREHRSRRASRVGRLRPQAARDGGPGASRGNGVSRRLQHTNACGASGSGDSVQEATRGGRRKAKAAKADHFCLFR